MMKLRNKIRQWLTGAAVKLEIEDKLTQKLIEVEPEDVSLNQLYEHYGRLVVAKENEHPTVEPCDMCQLLQLGIPCALHCDYRHYFQVVKTKHQYSTNPKEKVKESVRKANGYGR